MSSLLCNSRTSHRQLARNLSSSACQGRAVAPPQNQESRSPCGVRVSVSFDVAGVENSQSVQSQYSNCEWLGPTHRLPGSGAAPLKGVGTRRNCEGRARCGGLAYGQELSGPGTPILEGTNSRARHKTIEHHRAPVDRCQSSFVHPAHVDLTYRIGTDFLLRKCPSPPPEGDRAESC